MGSPDGWFSSTACLLRHEREAHGMHGHGARPHLCYYQDCERAVPGHGFPRRYNLFDHMKRVHGHNGDSTLLPPSSRVTEQQGPQFSRTNAQFSADSVNSKAPLRAEQALDGRQQQQRQHDSDNDYKLQLQVIEQVQQPRLAQEAGEEGYKLQIKLLEQQNMARRQDMRGACDSCRARQIKCDKKKPTCDSCEGFGVACNYSFLTSDEYTDMFGNLPYGDGANPTRVASDASFTEPWSYPARSPSPSASTVPYTWTQDLAKPLPPISVHEVGVELPPLLEVSPHTQDVSATMWPERARLSPLDEGVPTAKQTQEATSADSIEPLKRLRRPCDACFAAKSRCNRETPTCQRCGDKGISCNYSDNHALRKPSDLATRKKLSLSDYKKRQKKVLPPSLNSRGSAASRSSPHKLDSTGTG